ncbi:hypothetical protein RhiirA1_476386 [Rhizophagus irregularis]|uniref:Uncharacterized protein n=1 Tax=Rhizophagus irregularis TaxID=588596 RepID=A0A2N0QVD1_9GLOM|nr:hypothetical protein RhiirA1_476386 [Rhizophagus irregularis]
MIIVNCIVKENILIKASIDTSTDVNYISQKHIGELGITYHSESNRIVTSDTSYSTLGKVNLHIGFNDGEKYKTTPSEFIVAGPDWPDYFPDLVLGMPWLRENGVNFDMHNSLLTIDDNFTIPFEKVDYISTLSDSQIRTMTDFPSPTYSPECITSLIFSDRKYLLERDLKNSRSINNIWEREANLEWHKRMEFLFGRIVQGNYTVKEYYSKLKECNLSKDYPEWLFKNLFIRGLSPENKFKVCLDGLQALALDEIVESLSSEQ